MKSESNSEKVINDFWHHTCSGQASYPPKERRDCFAGLGTHMVKFEARNPKFETNSNIKILNIYFLHN